VLASLAVLGIVLLTAPLGVRSRGLWVGDETRDAAIAKAMAHSGDLLAPRLAGRVVPEKPPLFYALVALSYRTLGTSPVSTRLPSVLFFAAALLAAAGTARRLYSPRAAFLAAAMLATTYLFVVNAHDCVVDVGLTAEVALGYLAFVAASGKAGHPRWDSAFGFAAAAALLTKGFIGPAILLSLTTPWWVLSSPRPPMPRCVTPAAILIPAGALCGWVASIGARGGTAALYRQFFIHQFGRFVGMGGQEFSHHRVPFFSISLRCPGFSFPGR
jgi:4-amino-4-deoxy-L-arabinose transferase-like glycosyltransferase